MSENSSVGPTRVLGPSDQIFWRQPEDWEGPEINGDGKIVYRVKQGTLGAHIELGQSNVMGTQRFPSQDRSFSPGDEVWIIGTIMQLPEVE